MSNEIFFTYHTTSIEGFSLTLEETSVLITEGLTANAKDIVHHLMVLDHHQALAYLLA
jgi:Fic family protein